jgi:hypothetical protein
MIKVYFKDQRKMVELKVTMNWGSPKVEYYPGFMVLVNGFGERTSYPSDMIDNIVEWLEAQPKRW